MRRPASSLMLTVPIGDHDHVQGPATAPVTLLEYGDFECPFSRQGAEFVAILRAQYGDRLRFAFRHFPLIVKHPHAQLAAEAAEAAGVQGKFWEMYDLLFTNQRRIEHTDLVRYAGRLGLDTTWFVRALDECHFTARVVADVDGGQQSGVTGTPTYFINGRRHDGSEELSGLSEAVERALVKG